MSNQLLQSYTDNSRYFVIPEPLLDVITSLKLSYSETMVYVLHFNMGYRWKSWISTLTCRKIAERLRITERSVSLAHKKLTELGLIQRERGQRYSKFKEAPAATRIILTDALKRAFNDAPERNKPTSVNDRKLHQAIKPTNPEVRSPVPAPERQEEAAKKKSAPDIDTTSLPQDIADMITLGLSRTVIVGTLKSKSGLSKEKKQAILDFYDRKHSLRQDPKPAPKHIASVAQTASEDEAPRQHKRTPSPQLVEDIHTKLTWAVHGRTHDLRPGIAGEIAYAITIGTLSNKSIKHGLNIALKLVREGRWTPPAGYWMHEEQFARRA